MGAIQAYLLAKACFAFVIGLIGLCGATYIIEKIRGKKWKEKK